MIGFKIIQFYRTLNIASETKRRVIANALDTHGPAYASIGGELGGHVIVIDSVSDRSAPNPIVRIRDPFHGWDIDVRLSSLTKRGLDRELLVCSRVRSGDNRDRDV